MKWQRKFLSTVWYDFMTLFSWMFLF